MFRALPGTHLERGYSRGALGQGAVSSSGSNTSGTFLLLSAIAGSQGQKRLPILSHSAPPPSAGPSSCLPCPGLAPSTPEIPAAGASPATDRPGSILPAGRRAEGSMEPLEKAASSL